VSADLTNVGRKGWKNLIKESRVARRKRGRPQDVCAKGKRVGLKNLKKQENRVEDIGEPGFTRMIYDERTGETSQKARGEDHIW